MDSRLRGNDGLLSVAYLRGNMLVLKSLVGVVMKRVIWITLLILLLAACRDGGDAAADAALTAAAGEEVEVFIGDLASAASATGQLLPQDEAQLSLNITGEVAEMFVREGDRVAMGDPLLQLDTTVLARSVEQAEQNLLIQQANLDSLLVPANAEDIASAEASLASAEAALADILDGPSEEELASQEASIQSAQASVQSALASLSAARDSASAADIAAAEASLRAAQASVNASYQSQQDVQAGAGAEQLANARASLQSAEANVTTAQNNLNTLKNGATAEQISNAQASLQSAEANVSNAQNSLATLRNGASDAQIAQAEASLKQAQQQHKAAQDAYDQAFTCYEQDDGYLYCPFEAAQESASTNLEIANDNLAAAQATLAELLAGASPEEIWAAQQSLNSAVSQRDAAQQALNDLLDGTDDSDIWAAQQSLTSAIAQRDAAQITLNELQNGASEVDLQNATASLSSAISQRESAQANLDNLLEGPDSNNVASAQAQLASANAQVVAAQANLDLLMAGGTAAQIASARAQVAQAEASLANLQRGATETQIAIAEAQLRQAELQLEEARNNLENATLRAPFAGIVTDVRTTVGEVAGGVVMTLVNAETLAVFVDVDEIDLGELNEGDVASITFDAFPDIEIDAEVASIAPTASQSAENAIVSFEVRLGLIEEPPVELRIGMTANANLVTSQREDVLLVPNRAISADRARGVFTVNKVTGSGETQEITPVEITIGLRDNNFTQVSSGLEEGDRVLIGGVDAPLQGFGPPEGE